MADLVDQQDERDVVMMDAAVYQIRKKADAVTDAVSKALAGECSECGEHMPRLIIGVCCPCIDRRKIK